MFLVVLFDQFVKFWIKLNMNLGEEINVTDKLHAWLFGPSDASGVWGEWFILHFTENPGMAFGIEFAGEYGKLLLSLFRILAVFGITWYMWTLVQKKANRGLIVSIALILAGALGNIIDSAFYGVIFSESLSYYGAPHAQLFPSGGGYDTLLYGRVVDMLYFPVIDTRFPEWLPIWGGEKFLFFRPVFNIADSAITIGVAMIVLFQRRYFAQADKLPMPSENSKHTESTADNTDAEAVVNTDESELKPSEPPENPSPPEESKQP